MTTVLFLPTAPENGREYHLQAIIGEFGRDTAVCRGLGRRQTFTGSSIAKQTENGPVYTQYTDSYYQFLNPATGELFEVLVKVAGEL